MILLENILNKNLLIKLFHLEGNQYKNKMKTER